MLTFPHLGNLHIPLKALFLELKVDCLVPPPITPRTLQLGQLYAPEFACLPLKIQLGNFIQALEEGAETLLMIGGVGPCRLGLFALIEELILKDLSFDFTMVILEPSLKPLFSSLQKILPVYSFHRLIRALYFSYRKLLVVEAIAQKMNRARPHLKGISSLMEKYLSRVDASSTDMDLNQILKELETLPSNPKDLKVAIIGDIYSMIEPFANMNLEDHLGELGVVPYPSTSISQWIKEHLLLRPLGLFFNNPVEKAAWPYLQYPVGGLGLEGIGHSVLYAKGGFAGAIQVYPLTCMPELVSKGILAQVSQHLDFPIMSMVCDEERCPVGFQTRLEAFVELMKKRKG